MSAALHRSLAASFLAYVWLLVSCIAMLGGGNSGLLIMHVLGVLVSTGLLLRMCIVRGLNTFPTTVVCRVAYVAWACTVMQFVHNPPRLLALLASPIPHSIVAAVLGKLAWWHRLWGFKTQDTITHEDCTTTGAWIPFTQHVRHYTLGCTTRIALATSPLLSQLTASFTSLANLWYPLIPFQSTLLEVEYHTYAHAARTTLFHITCMSIMALGTLRGTFKGAPSWYRGAPLGAGLLAASIVVAWGTHPTVRSMGVRNAAAVCMCGIAMVVAILGGAVADGPTGGCARGCVVMACGMLLACCPGLLGLATTMQFGALLVFTVTHNCCGGAIHHPFVPSPPPCMVIALAIPTCLLLATFLYWRQHRHRQQFLHTILQDYPYGGLVNLQRYLRALADPSSAECGVEHMCVSMQHTPTTAEVLLSIDTHAGALGAPGALAGALQSTDEGRVLPALRLLLCLVHDNRPLLVDVWRVGVLDVLVRAPLQRGVGESVCLAALATAATLADAHAMHRVFVQAGLLRVCTQLMTTAHTDVVRAAAIHTVMVLLSARDSVVAQHAWCGKLVPMLVDVATVLDGRGSVRDAACAALAIIAVCNQSFLVTHMLLCGGLEALLLRLADPRDTMTATAAAAIAKLAACDEGVRRRVVALGCVPALVKVMTTGGEEGRVFAMYALEMVVSKGDPVAGAQFVGAQGVPSLVGMMVRPAPSHANVVARAASSSALLGNLYEAVPNIRPHVLAAGSLGLPALELLLRGSTAHCTDALVAQIHRDAQRAGGSGVLGLTVQDLKCMPRAA